MIVDDTPPAISAPVHRHEGEGDGRSSGLAPRRVSRRGLLAGLGAMSSAMLAARAAPALPQESYPSYRLEAETPVSGARLDREVANAFPLFDTASVLSDFDVKTQGAQRDVVLYRLVTTTRVPETNELLEVTGLLALPADAGKEIPVVSWQHGTILSFDQTPSNLTKLSNRDYRLSDEVDSLETLFNIHRFAANGFAVIAADYVGKGPLRNGRGEGYAVKGVTARTCADMLNAGLAALGKMATKPTKLFLHGWSQGALNTQWLHQMLRGDAVPIAATAVASPFNDLNEAWRFWAGRQTYPLPAGVDSYPEIPLWVPLCMIVLLGSYELHYGMNGLIEAAVRPQYREMARQYRKDYGAGLSDASSLPSGGDLLVPGFFDGYTDDLNSALLRQFAANGASYWHYDSEIRFHYGLVDEAIHPEMVARALSAGGKFARGVPVAGANHRATFLAGLYGDGGTLAGHDNTLSWFKSKL